MAIKSIDLQSMYPRTNDVSKTQNEEQQKNQALLHQQAKSTNTDVEAKMGQVVKKDKSEKAAIREKEEKDRQMKQKKKKSNNKKSNEKKNKNSDNINETNSIIDIKI